MKDKGVNNLEEEKRNKLETLLYAHGVRDVCLKNESKEIMMFECPSGSEIRIASNGTLGGYAMKGQELCALTAKHIAGGEKQVKLVMPQNGEIVIGEVLTAPQEIPHDTPVDILAAKLSKTVDETRLWSLNRQQMRSRVFDFVHGNTDDLQDRDVYIWGARTRPGLGKITMADFVRNDMLRCIVIEDVSHDVRDGIMSTLQEEYPKRPFFAREGDSGSIVCAETGEGTNVIAIAMLMGLKVQCDEDSPRQYMAFYLQQGLRQLEIGHNQTFELC